MAAITTATVGQRHVIGDLALRVITGVAGSTGDTLVVPVGGVIFAVAQPGSTITGIASAVVAGGATTTLTLTSSAPYTGAIILVLGTKA